MPGGRRNRPGLALGLGLAIVAVLAGVDAALGSGPTIIGTFLLAPLVAGLFGGGRETAAVAVVALAAAVASAAWNDNFGDSGYFIRIGLVAIGGAIASVGAAARARTGTDLSRFELLAAVGDVATGSSPLEDTVGRVLDLLVPAFADVATLDAPRSSGRGRIGVRVAGAPDGQVQERIAERAPTSPDASTGAARAAATGQSQLIASVSDEQLREIATGDDLDFMRSLGLRSIMFIPLRARDRDVGTLTCAVAGSGRSFDAGDLRFAEVLSGRIALALDNAGLSASLGSLERQMEATLENLAEAVTVQDTRGQTVFANRAAVELLRVGSASDAVGAAPGEMASWFEIFAEDGRRVSLDEMPGARVRAGEGAQEILVRNVLRATGEERWMINKATPLHAPDGTLSLVVNVIEDVTEVKRGELNQRLLAEAGAVLSSSLDYEQTLQQVAHLAVPQLADWCGVNMPDRHGRLLQMAVAVSDPDKAEVAARYGELYPGTMSDPGGAAEVIRSGEPQMVTEIPDALLAEAAQDEQHLGMLRALGMRAVIIVPLTTGARTIGALSLVMAESGRTFGERDLALAREIGRRAAVAVENARLYSERSEIAATLQRSLLPPDLPRMPGWTAATLYRAAGEQNEVGGDFYDAFEVPGGWLVLVGDVAGRGAEAAALTSLARYTLRAAGQILGDPVAAFARLNGTLRERPDLSMVSVCCVRLFVEHGGPRAAVLCAGHPPAYHLSPQGVTPVGNHAPFLGAFDDGEWTPAEVNLAPGDQLVLYTDGVLDTVGEDERFGEERLVAVLRGASRPEEAVGRIDDALTQFEVGAQQDDTAVLAVRREL